MRVTPFTTPKSGFQDSPRGQPSSVRASGHHSRDHERSGEDETDDHDTSSESWFGRVMRSFKGGSSVRHPESASAFVSAKTRLTSLGSNARVGAISLHRRGSLNIFDTPEQGISTAWEDVLHDAKATFMLLSVALFTLPSLVATFGLYIVFITLDTDEKYRSVGSFGLASFHWYLCLGLFFWPMMGFRKSFLVFMVSIIVTMGIFMVGWCSFTSFSAIGSQTLEAFAFSIGSVVFATMTFVFHGKHRFRKALFLASCGWPTAYINVTVFVWYYAGSKLLQDGHWLVELIVLGIGYPFFAAFSGRMMLADFVAYLCYSNMDCDQLEVFHFFVRMAKMCFFITAQTVLFRMTDDEGFLVANVLSILLESSGLYVHAKIATSKWVETDPDQPTTNLFKLWLQENQRTGNKTKFACFYFNESMTEKIGCFAVVFVTCGFQIVENLKLSANPFDVDPEPFRIIAYRGILLIIFEFTEDLLKKQVLKRSIGISLSHLKPVLTRHDSFLMGQYVAVTTSWLFLGQNLLDTYYNDN